MKNITVRLGDDEVTARVRRRAEQAGVPVDEFVAREARRVIAEARDEGRLPPVTRKYAGIGPPMTDGEFREFRRGYLTRKHQ